MTSTVCAFCEKHSHMTPRWGNKYIEQRPGFGPITLLQAVAMCDNCARASLGVATNPSTGSSDENHNFNSTPSENFVWYPSVGAMPDFPDVPERIARAAREAHAAESIRSVMSSILMARTVIEATAKAKGVTKGNLVAKIDELAEKNIIRADTKDAAHEIRQFGNDMAHGDIDDVPDAEDVRDVLILMDEILAEVFQGPARTARLRNRRTSAEGA